MGNFLKIKKVNIAIFLFLILNQFLINSYALNFRKIDLEYSNRNNLEKRNKIFKNLLAEKINEEDSITTKEIEEIEKFVEETFDSDDSDIFANQVKQLQEINNNSDLLENEPIKYLSFENRHLLYLDKIKRFPFVKNIRVKGTIAAFDLEIGENYGYLNNIGKKIKSLSIEKGLFIRPLGNVIYLLPPLCITDNQLEQSYNIICEILSEL